MKNPSPCYLRAFKLRVAGAVGFFAIAASPLMAADGSWNVNSGGNWSGSTNWSPVAVPGGAGSTVNITNNITAARTVTIDADSRTVGNLNIGDSDGTHAFTLARSGTAVLFFDTGGTASSQLNFSGSSNIITTEIRLANSLVLTNNSANLQNLNGNISAATSGTKIISLGAGGTGLMEQSLSAVISDGSGVISVRQNTAGSRLYLQGNNSYTGGTFLDAGYLAISTPSNNTALGSGVLTITGGTLANGGGAAATLNNNVTLGGDVVLIGSTVNSSSNTRLVLAGTATLTGNRVISVSNTTNALGGGYVVLQGGIRELGGSYSLTKSGSGALWINAGGKIVDYTGGTFINEGTLRLSTATGVNTLLSTGSVTVNGGIFDVAVGNRAIENVGALTLLSGSIIGSSGNSLLSGSSYNLHSGVVSKSLTGSNSTLSKLSSGTVTISGSNSYTGATTVSAGTLLINGNNTNATAAVTVNGGVLGGSGTIGGAITVNSGGTLAPGNSPGILTTTKSVTIADGGAFSAEITGATVGTEYDQVVMTGASSVFSLTGTNNLVLSLTYTPVEDTLFFLVDNQGNSAISGIFESLNGVLTDLSQGSFFTLGGQGFLISYEGSFIGNTFSGGNDIVLQAIPEPSTLVLFGLGAWVVFTRFGRKSRKS